MAINAVQYLKNVGKSFGYSAIDTLKAYNPAIASLASSAKEFSTELYDSIQDFTGKAVGTDDEKGFLGTGKDILKDARKNLFEDLKTGNWYNKQRISEVDNENMKEAFGFDFDDDDFGLDDDWDFDFDDDGSDESLASAVVQSQKKSTDSIISSMDAVGAKAAGAVSNATVRSADYVAQISKQNSKALYGLNQRGFQQVSTGIAAVNANISTLVTLGEPLTTHMQNSATFYTKSSEYQTAVLEKLDKILKVISPEENKTTRRKHTFADMFTAEGTLDFGAYFDMIKDNVKEAKDGTLGMLDMAGGVKGIAKSITASPMKFVTDQIVQTMIPQMMKDSMTSFNEALGSFFPAMLDRMQNNAKPGGIMDLLGGFLFPKRDLKKNFDTSKYNHGVTQWTGESEIALKEVIPTYLAYITAALTGQPVTRFDYTRGKFVRRTAVKSYAMNRFADEAKRAGGRFREDSISAAKAAGLDKENEEAMIQQIENYFMTAFERADGKATDIANPKKNFNAKDYGMSEDAANLLRAVLKAYEETGQTRNAVKFAGDVRAGRERYAQNMRELEVNGDVTRSVFDNSDILGALNEIKDDASVEEKQKVLFGTDELNHDIFYYLRGIYQHTGFTATYAPAAAIGTGPTSGNGGGGVAHSIEEFVIPKGKSGSELVQEAKDKAEKKLKDEQGSLAEGEGKDTTYYTRIAKSVLESGKGSAVGAKGERSRRKANEDAKRNEKNAQRYLDIDEYSEDEENKPFVDSLTDRLSGSEKVRRFGKIQDKIQDIMSTPTKVMTEILSSGEEAMYRLIYGKSDEEEGLFSYFFKKADSLFTKVDDHFKEKFDFSLKEWGKKFFGGFWNDTKESGKEAWNWTKEKVGGVLGFGSKNKDEGETEESKESSGSKLGNIVENAVKKNNLNTDEGGAARGRNVTKTGVISVSEGEFIVPAKYNPYYNGPVHSTAYQLAQERAAARNYFGNYAEGGTAEDDKSLDPHNLPPTGGWFDQKTGKAYASKADAPDGANLKWYNNGTRLKGAIDWFKNKAFDKNGKVDAGRTKRNIKIDNYEEGDSDLNVKNILGTAGSKAMNGIQDLIKRIVPDDPDKEAGILSKVFSDENKKALKDANIKDEMISNRGAMGVGAIVGAGASLLTGGIVGPFLGAGIGAATGLVIKSDKVQKALFGDVDSETGERSGGILSKKVSDFMTNELKGIGIGAGVGGVAGLFMGSPVMGAILGGTIGFVAKSDKVKNALFGEKDEDGNRTGGLIKKEMQDRLKKALPNMAVGGIAGLLVGPFGPVGNIILGSAIGYATTSEKFKSIVLGEKGEDGKRHGGMVGRLGNVVGGVAKDIKGYFLGYTDKKGEKRQGILDSIQSIFKNLANQLSQGAKNMFSRLTKSIRDRAAQAIVKSTKQRLAKAAGSRVVRGAKKVGKAVINAPKIPFRVAAGGLERLDQGVQRRGLRKGYNVVNKDGTRMIARERQNRREELGMNNTAKKGVGRAGSNVNFDEMLAGIESEEELRELQQFYQYYYDPNKLYNEQESSASNALAQALDAAGVDYKQAMELEEAAKGKVSRKRRKAGQGRDDILAELGLSEEQTSEINEYFKQIDEARANRDSVAIDKEQARKDLLDKSKFGDRFKQLGIKMGDRDVFNDIELIGDELEGRFGIDKKEEAKQKKKEEKEGKVQDSVININDMVQKILYRIEGKDEDGKELTPEELEERKYESIFYGRTDENGTLVPDMTREEMMERLAKEEEAAEKAANKKHPFKRDKVLATVSEGENIVDADTMTGDEAEIAENGYAEGGTVGGPKKRGNGFLGKIFNLVSGIYKKIVGEDGKAANSDDTEGGQDKGLADNNDKVIQKATEDGVVQYIQDKDGDMVENTSDPGTKAVLEAREEKRKGFAAMPKMAAMLGGIGGTLTGLGAKLFGSGGEKKKGIFATLLESLTGEGSFFGGIFNIFSKLFGGTAVGKAGKAVASAVKGISVSSVLGGALIAGLVTAFVGGFDGIFATLGEKISALKGNDTTSTLDDNTSQTITDKDTGEVYNVATDDDGNPITNEDGEYLTTTGEYVSGNTATIGSDTSLSSQLKKNLATGLATGGSSVMVKGIAKGVSLVTGKSIKTTSIKSAAKSIATSAASGATSGVLLSLRNTITNFITGKFPTIISNCPLLPASLKDNADDVALALAEKLDDAVVNNADKIAKVATTISNAMAVIKVVTIVAAAVDGWGNAESILGITDDATTGQRAIAALIAALNSAIPVVGNIIPNKVIVNIFMEIAEKVGLDVSGLAEQREAAEAEVEAYNEENGTDLSIEEYNQMNGKAGIITKAKNKVKSTVSNIKQQGLKTTVSNAIQTRKTKRANGETIGAKLTSGMSNIGSRIKETSSNVFDALKNNSISQGYQSMLKLAISGEIGDLIKSQIIDTSDEESESGAMAKIVNGTLGTISKIQLVPLAAICKIGVSIKNAFTNIVNKIKNGFSLFTQSFKDTEEIMTSKDEVTMAQVFDTSKYEDEENPLNGIQTSLIMVGKLVSIGVLFVRRIGRAIAKPFKKLASVVKDNVTGVASDTSNIADISKEGKIAEIWQYKVSENEESPTNGFTQAMGFISKLVYTPVAAVVKVGKAIKTVFTKTAEVVKDNVSGVVDNDTNIRDLAKTGSISDMWSYSVAENEESPVNGFTHAMGFISKLTYTPLALIFKVGNAISTAFTSLVDRIKSGSERVSEETDVMRDLAKEGDISGVVTYTVEDDEENPIGGFQKAIVQLNKIIYTPVAIVHKVGTTVKTSFETFVDNISDDWESFENSEAKIKSYAEDGKPGDVLSTKYTGSSILSPVLKGVFGIEKLFYAVGAAVNKVFSTIGSFFSAFLGDDDSGSSTNKLLNKFKNFLNNDTDDDDSGAGSGIRRVGGASDITKDQGDYFVSQTDPKYSNITYGNSTIGDIGCAPAAATMLINYSKPGSISMKDAIKDARKYEENNGTSADYFGSELDKYGMSSTYINGESSKGQKSIKNALAAGHPAVLLGQNTDNRSKNKSPFGPNNHFVTATGIDSKGNIIINDPESDETKLYDSSILKSVSLGVATDMPESDAGNVTGLVGGTSYPDNKTTQNVWAYFKAKGYSDAATAGIMGNAYAESGIDPTRYQNGGPAAGMFQWENYKTNSGRYKSLVEYANKNNLEWTDLDAQLPFVDSELQNLGAFWHSPTSNFTKAGATTTSYDAWRSSTDVDMATRQFEAAFERAGKPAIDKRVAAAKYYNTNYANQSFTYDGVADTSSSYSSSSSSSSDSSESYTIFDVVSAIGSALSSALTGSSDSSSSSSSSSSDTVYSGNGSTTGTAEQQKLVSLLQGIAGTLTYSMSGARNPDKGSADCSSTVNWAYKKVFGDDVGNSTLAMIQSSNTKVVDQATSGMDYSSGGTNSSGPNVDNLAPGDILLFSRPSSSYSSGRPYRVGHVEMYAGNNQTIGHGGPGKGPTVKDLSRDSKRYIQARRHKSLVSGAGSGLADAQWPTVNRLEASAVGGGSGNKILKFNNYVGGASNTSTANDNNTIIKLLKSILQEAKNIVTNTEDISTISDNIINYAEALEEMKSKVTSGSSSTTSNANKSSVSTNVSPEDDPGIQDLVETLNAIAAG